MRLYQITAPHFVAGIVFDNTVTERAVLAAPILWWAVRGRYSRIKFLLRCSDKGWKAVEISKLVDGERKHGTLTDCDMK